MRCDEMRRRGQDRHSSHLDRYNLLLCICAGRSTLPTTRVVQPGCNAAWLCFCSQAANFLQPGSAFCSLGPNLQPGSARASQAAKIRARLQAAERQAAPGCKPGCSLAALGCSLAEKPRARLQIRKLQPGSAQAANMEPGCSPNAAPEAWAAAWLGLQPGSSTHVPAQLWQREGHLRGFVLIIVPVARGSG